MLETARTCSSRSVLPRASSIFSSSYEVSKWSSIAFLPRPVTMMILVRPAATASSMTYWMIGLSTRGSISFGWALVAGRNRVPRPAAGNTIPPRDQGPAEGDAAPRRSEEHTSDLQSLTNQLSRLRPEKRDDDG